MIFCATRWSSRGLDGDAPGRSVGFAAFGLELSGDLHQIAAHAQFFQAIDHTVHRISRGNAVEVQLQRDRLAQLIAFDTQMPMARKRSRLGNLFLRRNTLAAPLRAEAQRLSKARV